MAKDLKQINHEILIGIGSEDNMVSKEESEKAAGDLPTGNLKIFDGFRHPIEQVNPKDLAKRHWRHLLINRKFTT